MATVTGMTAAAMQAIAAASVVDGVIDENGNLILTTHGGNSFIAGHVKGDKGDPATALLLPQDSVTVDLTRTGLGTPEDPWVVRADLKYPPKLMQLAMDTIGPGPAYVTDIGDGLGTRFGPFDWDGKFDPVGSPLVRLEGRDDKYVIVGHASGNSLCSIREVPLSSKDDWVTYGIKNGTKFGPLSNAMQATLTTTGIVVLQGLYIARKAFSATTGLIGTLPVGMRPDTVMVFPINQSDNIGEVRIYPDGKVIVQTPVSQGQYVSLTNIAFPAAGVATWTPITTYLNGYSDYGDPQFGQARYWVDPYGIVWWAGLVKVGATTTGGTHAFSMPASITQPDSHHETVAVALQQMGSIRFSGSITAATAGGTGGIGYVDVLSGMTSGGWFSLFGCTTLTQAGLVSLPWDNLYNQGRFANGFTAYNSTVNSGNQMPIIAKRPDGLVMTFGLVRTDSGTIGQAIFFLEERMLPNSVLLQQAVANATRARIDISGRTNDVPADYRAFKAQQGTTPWLSMDNFKWIPGAAA